MPATVIDPRLVVGDDDLARAEVPAERHVARADPERQVVRAGRHVGLARPEEQPLAARLATVCPNPHLDVDLLASDPV